MSRSIAGSIMSARALFCVLRDWTGQTPSEDALFRCCMVFYCWALFLQNQREITKWGIINSRGSVAALSVRWADLRPRGPVERPFPQLYSCIRESFDTLALPDFYVRDLHALGLQACLHIANLSRQHQQGNAVRECSNPWNDPSLPRLYCLHCYPSSWMFLSH
jgi:hypothetical protein